MQKNVEKYCGGEKIFASRPRGCNIAWENAPAAPAVPTPLRDNGRGAYGMNCMDEKAPSNYDTIRYEMLF